MEKTTIFTYLYYKEASAASSVAFTQLVDITSYPDIMPAPERLERNDMSSDSKHYEPGLKDPGDMEFGYNYTKAAYDALYALEDKELTLQLRFGADGSYGAWEWNGTIKVSPGSGETNSIRAGTIRVYPTTDVSIATL